MLQKPSHVLLQCRQPMLEFNWAHFGPLGCYSNHRMSSGIHDLVMFLMWFWCSSRAPFVPSCFPSRFFILGWFWFVLVALDRSMTWVETFHRRKSTNSSRDCRSGQFKFLTYFLGDSSIPSIHGVRVCFGPWSFRGCFSTRLWTLVQSFKSFGVDLIKLDLIFLEKLLVHTGRVRYF